MPSAGIFGSARVAAVGGSLAVTYQSNGFDLTDGTSYTFASQPIGTAAADRRVVVALSWAAAGAISLSGMTIGGISATVDADTGTLASNRRVVLCSAIVPTGTTASVVATLSGTATRAGYSVATINGDPTGQTATASTNTGSLVVTTTTGDIVIATGLATNSANTNTFAWTSGLDTEWFNVNSASDGGQYHLHSGGYSTATGSSVTLNYSTTNTTSRGGLAAAYA